MPNKLLLLIEQDSLVKQIKLNCNGKNLLVKLQ